MSHTYGIRLEKKFQTVNNIAMALFPEEDDILHNPLSLFKTSENPCDSPIFKINNLFLKRGYNPLYFSRRNILRIRENNSGIKEPLNKEAYTSDRERLDSS